MKAKRLRIRKVRKVRTAVLYTCYVLAAYAALYAATMSPTSRAYSERSCLITTNSVTCGR